MIRRRNKLPNELPESLPAFIRRDYELALVSLRERYTDQQILAFIQQIGPDFGRYIATHGLPKPWEPQWGQQISTTSPRKRVVPLGAVHDVQRLMQALSDADRIRHDGLKAYLGEHAYAEVVETQRRQDRNKGQMVRQRYKEVWQLFARGIADKYLTDHPNAKLLAVADVCRDAILKRLKRAPTVGTIERYLKSIKVKSMKRRTSAEPRGKQKRPRRKSR